jgi:hypothetical protein
MNDMQIIDLTPDTIAEYGVCGYKDVGKHIELANKIAWFRKYYPKGLRIKTLLSMQGDYQGMIEYMPGEIAHRPVDAQGYLFIQCLFVGFKKEFKGKGHASSLINSCIAEAKERKMSGVAVVTRKGPFMADSAIFLKNGFQVVDHAGPDFELLVYKFDPKSMNPGFKPNMLNGLQAYQEGLTVIRSAQCPYTEKNVRAIIESAQNKFSLAASLITLDDVEAVQSVPCAFGTFCIIHNGQVISHHPISNARFEKIMKNRVMIDQE